MCEAIVAAAGTILALYGWSYLQNSSNEPSAISIDIVAAIAAGLTLIFCVVTYIFVRVKNYATVGIIGYLLLVVMILALVMTTGYTASPFIAFWMTIALAAPAFGIIGLVAILAPTIGYLIMLYLANNLQMQSVLTVIILSIMPMTAGLLIWRQKSGELGDDLEGDRSYHELANELSTISGQSEIVIAAITDGVIALNAKGQVQLINPAAQRLIGWGKTDALGLDYKSVLKIIDNHDQAVNDTNDPVRKAISTNHEVVADTFYLVTQDSKKKFLASITVSPVGTTGSGVILVFRDITKERAQEREQAEFISTASHEMRTPVASIEGYLGLALNPTTAQIDDNAREYITKAQSSVTHLGRLFQDLLDVTKADDGRLTNTPEMVDVVSFVHDIITGQLQKALDKGIFVSYPPMPDLDPSNSNNNNSNKTLSPVYYINVDNTHFREVIGNLIENAIKYTPQGSVVINVEADNDFVTISVKDTGIGIPKEDIQHLFQKFYRVDNSDTREIGGTGLGLYLSRKLVEVMGGRIWVESIYKKGSTFFVKFPRVDTVTAHQQIEQAGESQAEELSTPGSFMTTEPAQPTSQVPISPSNPAPNPAPQPVAAAVAAPQPTNLPQPPVATAPPRAPAVHHAPMSVPSLRIPTRPNLDNQGRTQNH